MSGEVDLVLFDLDGTLTESGSGILGAYRHTLGTLGLDADEAALRRCIGPPIAVSLASLGVPADEMVSAIATWRAWFSEHGIFDNRLYDGVPTMVDRIRAAGIRTGLATAKLHAQAVRILDHFALSDRFEAVCGATADGRLTTKDEIIAEALTELGVPGSERVLMIGDREHDMFGATANDVAPVGVTYGYGSRAELEASGARWIVDSPHGVAELVLGLAGA